MKSRLLTRDQRRHADVGSPAAGESSWAGSAAGTGPVAWQPDAALTGVERSKLWRTGQHRAERCLALRRRFHRRHRGERKGDRLAYTTKVRANAFVLSVATRTCNGAEVNW